MAYGSDRAAAATKTNAQHAKPFTYLCIWMNSENQAITLALHRTRKVYVVDCPWQSQRDFFEIMSD
jgi:hypothetical protein